MTAEAPPTAYVLNLFGTGLGIARSLGRLGIPVVGVSGSAEAPGAGTRYARHVVGPDSERDPERLRDFLLDLASRDRGRGVLFPTRDQDLFFIDAHRDALEARFAVSAPPREALRAILDKATLSAFAAAHGVDTPRTTRVASPEDLERERESFLFPCVLKPLRAVDWRRPGVWERVGRRKGIRLRSLEALREAYGRIAPFAPEAIVQEWIPGAEDRFFVLGAAIDRGGRCRAAFTARKMLQYPPEFGLGCVVRLVSEPEVERIGLALLAALGFHGVAEVEFKRDGRTGGLRLIEINPRPWDQHTLGTLCGANIARAAYDDLAGRPAAPRSGPARGPMRGTWLDERGVLGSLREDARRLRWRTARLLLASLAAPRVYTLWAADDRAPFRDAFGGRGRGGAARGR